MISIGGRKIIPMVSVSDRMCSLEWTAGPIDQAIKQIGTPGSVFMIPLLSH